MNLTARTEARFPRRLEVYLVLLIGFAAVATRLYRLGDLGGLWLDEIWTVMEASGRAAQVMDLSAPPGAVVADARVWDRERWAPLWQVWGGMGAELHPPLPAVLLRAWIDVLGSSDFVLRLASVLCSWGAIALLYFLARWAVGVRGALVATALLTLSWGGVYFAQECRSYMLLQLLTLGLAGHCVRYRGQLSWPGAAILASVLLAGMLTHYYFLGPAIGVVGYWLLSSRRGEAVKVLTGAGMAAALFGLLWGRELLRQRGNWAFESHLMDREFAWWKVVLGGVALPVRFIYPGGSATQTPVVVAGGLLWAVCVLGAWRFARVRGVLACLAGGAVLLGAADALRHARSLDLPRYAIHLAPLTCLLLGSAFEAGVSALSRVWLREAMIGGALLVIGYSTYLTLTHAYQPKGGWRDFAGSVAAQLKPGDLLVFHSDGTNDWKPYAMFFCYAYYAPPDVRAKYPHLIVRGSEPLNLAIVEGTSRVWLLTGRGVAYPPPDLLPGWKQTWAGPCEMPSAAGTPNSVRLLRSVAPTTRRTATASTLPG